MARGEHRPSCAKTWRERAEREGMSSWQTVQAIHDCCGVSYLKAHRLARGWTASAAIEELARLCARENLPAPKANIDLLNSWENGRSRPLVETIDQLARLYKSNSIRLGFAADYGDEETAPVVPVAREITSPVGSDAAPAALFYRYLRSPAHPVADLLAEVEHVRKWMDRTLAQGTVTEDQMDQLDETVLRLRQDHLVTPPLVMLCQLMYVPGCRTGARHCQAIRGWA
ncbi:helix-turn-helix domain-containing protein [Actinomadura rupiterrae]|uniref:helix-turn-helix domain-containing protein n=1 Tax=Actinomadura rupiterrae TaxID=559627 RepID=UPI0020A6037C|nr:helix-turn-helix transcriptional regulator [Actinomadura rupiterrae]MCP2337387.1 hypothetical protein [Actinomadura rupiterrae]